MFKVNNENIITIHHNLLWLVMFFISLILSVKLCITNLFNKNKLLDFNPGLQLDDLLERSNVKGLEGTSVPYSLVLLWLFQFLNYFVLLGCWILF